MRPTHLLVLLGSIVLSAVVLWFVSLRDDEAPRELARPEVAVPAAGDVQAVLERADAPTIDSPPAGAPSATGSERRAAPEPSADGLAALPDAETVRVLVLAAESGRPLPGARVQLVRTASRSERDAFWELAQVDRLLERRGTELVADAEGTVEVPRPLDTTAGWTLLASEHEGLWGRLQIAASTPEPLRLELEPDGTIDVVVVGSGRGPAAGPIAGTGVELCARESGYATTLLEATTDEEGRARLAHVTRVLTSSEGETYVTLAAVLREPPEVPVDPDRLPDRPVELVLPAHGAVEVRLFEDGEPYDAAASVSLGIVREGEPRELSPFSNHERPRRSVEADRGRVRFPIVDLDCELEVGARREGAYRETLVFGDGPREPGETAAIDVPPGIAHPVVALRALDAKGVPLASAELRAAVELFADYINSRQEARVTTDAVGFFRLDFSPDWTTGSVRRVSFEHVDEAQRRTTAELDLSRRFEPGVHPLGDLIFGPPRLLAAGRVVDSAGSPVAGATVELETRVEERWSRVWAISVETDELGVFQIEGELGVFQIEGSRAGEEFRLRPRLEGSIGDPVPFAPGDAALTLVLRAAGRVEGAVLVREGVAPDALDLVLVREDVEEPLAQDTPFADGTFSFGELEPGVYSLSVGLDGGEDPLAKIEGIVVRGGRAADDPRLERIDLRELVFAVRLHLSGKGASSWNGQTRSGPAGSDLDEGGRQRSFHGESVVALLGERERFDVDLAVPGHRLLQLRGVSGDVDVRLEPGLPVRVRLTGDAVVPEPPHFLKLVLVGDNGSFGIDWGAASFDESRELSLRVQEPGMLRVRWIVERRADGSSMAMAMDHSAEPTVEVEDVDYEQVVEVELSQEQLDRILDF